MATLRRLATPDTLLVAIAGAILCFLLRPAGQVCQSIRMTYASGQTSEHWLPLQHPTLKELKLRFDGPDRHLPPAPLAIAKWHRELADFYSRHAADDRHNAFVVPVAYYDLGGDPNESQTDESSASKVAGGDPAHRDYWLAAKRAAEHAIERAEQQWSRRQTRQPRVVFGAVYQDQHIPLALGFSLLGGLLLGGGYVQWRQQRGLHEYEVTRRVSEE